MEATTTVQIQDNGRNNVNVYNVTGGRDQAMTDEIVEWAKATFGTRGVLSVGFTVRISTNAFNKSGLALGVQAI